MFRFVVSPFSLNSANLSDINIPSHRKILGEVSKFYRNWPPPVSNLVVYPMVAFLTLRFIAPRRNFIRVPMYQTIPRPSSTNIDVLRVSFRLTYLYYPSSFVFSQFLHYQLHLLAVNHLMHRLEKFLRIFSEVPRSMFNFIQIFAVSFYQTFKHFTYFLLVFPGCGNLLNFPWYPGGPGITSNLLVANNTIITSPINPVWLSMT